MSDPRVWCILITSDNVPFGDPFRVDLENHEQVLDLMSKIKGVYMDELAHVNLSREMEVWRRPTLTLSNAGLDEVSEWVRQLEFPRDDKRLGGWEHIQLPDYEPLVVKVLHSLKAKRTREDDYLESARSSKLARLVPNKLDNPSIYEALQGSRGEGILDDSPGPDSDLPPLSLISSGFGKLRDFISNPANYLPRKTK